MNKLRIERAMTQFLYLVDYEEINPTHREFSVLGPTGHFFVFLKVLKINPNSYFIYQKALITKELRFIFNKSPKITLPNEKEIEMLKEIASIKRRPIDGNCSVCAKVVVVTIYIKIAFPNGQIKKSLVYIVEPNGKIECELDMSRLFFNLHALIAKVVVVTIYIKIAFPNGQIKKSLVYIVEPNGKIECELDMSRLFFNLHALILTEIHNSDNLKLFIYRSEDYEIRVIDVINGNKNELFFARG
ncbi:hypothetical protein Glove_297g12 [Diversispora epigaea]|uniref:Uncharacterized protein n=1 Tax=Diversispora epigaea TaxID=1348612 RepID=A0A397HXT7_9GLOM|nr:hypothetical protein Glove_297g12 [Diversispora epigaea]